MATNPAHWPRNIMTYDQFIAWDDRRIRRLKRERKRGPRPRKPKAVRPPTVLPIVRVVRAADGALLQAFYRRGTREVPIIQAPPPLQVEGRKPRVKNGYGYQSSTTRLAWRRGDPCAYCGDRSNTWDHITSRKRGGDHGEENLIRSCHSCNHEKSSRTLLMFLAVRAQRKAAGTWRKLPPSRLSKRP